MNRYCCKRAATHPNDSHAFDQAAHAPVHHSLRRRIPALPLSCLRHPCPLRYWNIQEPIFIVRKALTELLCPQWSKIVTYSLGSPRVFAHGGSHSRHARPHPRHKSLLWNAGKRTLSVGLPSMELLSPGQHLDDRLHPLLSGFRVLRSLEPVSY